MTIDATVIDTIKRECVEWGNKWVVIEILGNIVTKSIEGRGNEWEGEWKPRKREHYKKEVGKYTTCSQLAHKKDNWKERKKPICLKGVHHSFSYNSENLGTTRIANNMECLCELWHMYSYTIPQSLKWLLKTIINGESVHAKWMEERTIKSLIHTLILARPCIPLTDELLEGRELILFISKPQA